MQSAEELYAVHEKRIRDAVALKTPDRIPVVPNGPAWPGRAMGVKISEIATNPVVSRQTVVDAYTGLGDIDGIQSPAYHVCTLSIQWLSKVKVPGRDLPDDELWQVNESEIMKLEDYDAILAEGFAPWLDRYYRERLPGTLEEFASFVATIPGALALCRDRGVVPMTPAVATIPYEYFCGGRSMKEFLLDLFRHGDKVQAAMDEALPVLIENMRGVIRGLGLMGLWIGGWRSASEFVSPRLWNRFVWPYMKELVEIVAEEGGTPVLHYDANWDREIERLKDLPARRCVLELDGKTDIFRAKKILAGHMCILGDVHPAMLTLGTVADVKAYCNRLLDEVGPDGFIMAMGCAIPPDAKFENVKAMVDSVQR